MKLRTCLHLSAVFPTVFALAVILLLRSQSVDMDITFVAMFGLLGITMAAVIVSYSRTILARIRTLNDWADSVLKGDLTHQIDIAGNDEVGLLSRALSKMLRELKDAYAAVHRESELHKQEAEERKRNQRAAETAANALSDALTRLKSAQEGLIHQERMRVLERMVRGLTHDLSDSMTPILGLCELIERVPGSLDNKASLLADIKTIHDSANRIKTLLRRLSDFFRPTRETAGPTDASVVIQQAIEMTKPYWQEEAGSEGRKIEVRTSLGMTPAVGVAEGDLLDALMSLITNSADAMPDGGIISIASRTEGSLVLVEVRDTGKGMSDETRQRCLEPFFTTKIGRGSGMGLTIVNSLVSRCGGTLDIESKLNAGTRIGLGLPVWAKTPQRDAETMVEPGIRKGLRILLVDDDPLSLRVVAKTLSLDGHTVETADSGMEGLEKATHGEFDAAIIDRAMGDMSGEALANTLARRRPDLAVVMLTGFGGIMLAEKEVLPAVDAIVAKPSTMEELRRGLVKAISARKTKSRGAPQEEGSAGDGGKTILRRQEAEGEGADGKAFKWVH